MSLFRFTATASQFCLLASLDMLFTLPFHNLVSLGFRQDNLRFNGRNIGIMENKMETITMGFNGLFGVWGLGFKLFLNGKRARPLQVRVETLLPALCLPEGFFLVRSGYNVLGTSDTRQKIQLGRRKSQS